MLRNTDLFFVICSRRQRAACLVHHLVQQLMLRRRLSAAPCLRQRLVRLQRLLAQQQQLQPQHWEADSVALAQQQHQQVSRVYLEHRLLAQHLRHSVASGRVPALRQQVASVDLEQRQRQHQHLVALAPPSPRLSAAAHLHQVITRQRLRQSHKFTYIFAAFGKPATATVTPGFGGFGGTNFMLGQPQQQPVPISSDEAFAQSILNVSIFGDERDNIVAKWNYLQAMWGTGKLFYSQSAAPVDITQENYLCRFKAIGYSRMPGKDNKLGLVALNFDRELAVVK